MNRILIICLITLLYSCQSTIKETEEQKNISDFAIRILGKEHAKNFIFKKIESASDKDEFEISFKDDKILIKGNTPIAMASGLNWYLKYYAKTHISWEARQMNLPNQLPVVAKPVSKKSLFTYSYYLNYCTFNYTMAFWDWERWEKEIDWMALNGINLPLSIIGTEAIWQNTLKRLDFTPSEINEFIPGPAFNAWWLMGNLEGWGGPLSDTYIQQQVTLQKKILNRMRSLGMKPVVSGFYGMVPNSLKQKYPNADIRDQGLWAGGFKRPAFLSPNDSLFNDISKIYYEELKKLYGDVEYFSGDPFHEGGSTNGIDLPVAGKNIIYGMRASFPKSVWVFQGWGGNPLNELIKDISDEDLLILDLDCDNRPQWEERKGWNKKPWIWSAINNFGGNTGMFGRMDVIATEPFRALKHAEYSSNLKGIGAMMEGTENNSIIYELLFELKWHHESPDMKKWLSDYTIRRYGTDNAQLKEAWQILRNTVYGKQLDKANSQQGTSEAIFCARPALKIDQVSTWGTSKLYYDPAELLEAWSIFVHQADQIKESQGFDYDVVDITRQVLANYSQVLHRKVVTAYEENNKADFEKFSKQFLELLDDEDSLLSSIDQLMLGKWIADARARGTNEKEKDLFEFNARTQITTWSFTDSDLHEYSHREWSGLITDFYKPRWKIFFDHLAQKMNGQNPKEPNYYLFEENWTKQTNKFPSTASQNPIKESKRIYDKYFNEIESSYK